MATPNEAQRPRSQTPEAGNAYDNELRQEANDDDWPTLISSSEQVYPDQVDNTVQLQAEEAFLNAIVSGGSGQSSPQASQQASQQDSQPAPIRVLTRPVSSDKDPAAGFSFTKAKPMQQLDFRRPKQVPLNPQPPDLPSPSEGISTEAHSRRSPSLRATTHIVQDVVGSEAHQSPSPEHHNASMLNESPSVAFPNATPTDAWTYNYPTPMMTSGPIMLNLSPIHKPSNEVSIAAGDSLTDFNLIETNEPRLLNIKFPDHSKPVTPLASDHNLAEAVRVVDQQKVNMQDRSRKASKDPLTSVAGVPKITKPRRRKTTTGAATDGPAPPSNPKSAYTEDDLFRLLMYRRRQGQQELEYFKATQQQKEAEIQKLRDMSNHLSSQLQEVEQRETQKTAELSRIKANKPVWEGKIKRLSDYVKGLTNDHRRLREDADDLQKQHADVFIVGEELQNALEDAEKSVKQERVRFQQLEVGARHRFESLAQTIQHQHTQLRSGETLLMAEREKGNRLEDQISRITASHEQLLELFTDHRDNITGKIDGLLQQAQTFVPPTKASELESPNPIRPMLEQCVGMLEMLQKVDTIKPEDLRKLNDTMDTFVKGIAHSVEACEENSISIEAGQKQLALAMQDQLRALSGNIHSEHALSEQINDLREMRATVRERLQATECSLADARREIVALRLRDQEQSRKIVALETDAAKAQGQSAEVPQLLLRVQDLDSRNKDLQTEVVTSRKEAADLSTQFQKSVTEARQVTEHLAVLQEKLEAAHKEKASLREEKSASEKQALLDWEQLRKELSKAANMQLASMQNEHMNIIHQLKLKKSSVEEKLKEVSKQVTLLRAEKEKSEKENGQLQVLLKVAQSDKDAVIGTRKALQLHLKELEARTQEKNSQHADMQAMLNKANDQIKAKDLEIMALRVSLAKRPTSSRSIEQNKTVRGAQLISNSHGLHRDSEHASINQSPSVRPTSSTTSRHFMNRPPVVEDSQPTEKPNFMNLDDFMLEDPFSGYAREGSQTIAGEDISALFPSTPGAGPRAEGVDYSRKSVVRTRIVSETQQRQHQSLREATPIAGKPTANRSQSQLRIHTKPGQIDTLPRSSVATPPTKVTSSGLDPSVPSSRRRASITRESTQPQGSVKDPRQGKRNTVAAEFSDTNSQSRPNKVRKAEHTKQGKALGPFIEDSQSPVLNGRSRKMIKRKPTAPKVDKFTRRFAQS